MRKSRNGTPNAEKVMHEWGQTSQPQPVPGQYSDSPSNRPSPRHPPRGVPVSSPLVPDAPGVAWNYQDLRPSAVPVVQADASNPGPFARSVTAHVNLAQQRHDRTSQPHLAGQLGDRAPMGPEGAARRMPGATEVATASDQPGKPASPAPHPDGARDAGIFTLAKLLATAQTTAAASLPDRSEGQRYGPVPDVAAPGRDYGGYHQASLHPGDRIAAGTNHAGSVPVTLPAGWQYTSRPPGGD